jgi:hypothetical protein
VVSVSGLGAVRLAGGLPGLAVLGLGLFRLGQPRTSAFVSAAFSLRSVSALTQASNSFFSAGSFLGSIDQRSP